VASLREVRAARLLSIRELAELASVAPSTVYLIETGKTIPRARVVRSLAAVLAVDPDEIDEFRLAIAIMRSSRRVDRRGTKRSEPNGQPGPSTTGC
jgi:transcriptional regulator with XRE-family HTH domain